MIALPPELLAQYPQQGTFPERPWWIDGMSIRRRLDNIRPTEARLSECKTRDDLLAAMAYVDEIKPIPHPGIRVGQVWALVYRSCDPDVFMITDFDMGKIGHRFGQSEVTPWFIGSHWISDEELKDILKINSILLSDMCCPHLAPWSTVKHVWPERTK